MRTTHLRLRLYKWLSGDWVLVAYAPDVACALRTARALGGSVKFEREGVDV